MQTRTLTIAALAFAAAVAGPLVLQLLPATPAAVPWFGHVLAAAGAAIGVPMLLGSAGSGGNFVAVARLWSALGALAIVLAVAGASAAAVQLRTGTGMAGGLALLALSTGIGLLAGLGLVKLALRKASVNKSG